jgi:hypothetical protein
MRLPGTPDPLAQGLTLVVRSPGTGVVFQSSGRWLHPLFDLGEYLGAHPEIDPGSLVLRDRVVGRAAAFLMVQFGIRTLGTDVVSQRAIPVLDGAGIRWSATEVVDRIGCQTEDLLAEVSDPLAAWQILEVRRLAALGRN